ncbi:MAG: OmpA family protein, partial [Candidatus Puniceispirillaceae bacterium]
ASDTASEAKQADQKVEDETVETARPEEPSLESLIYPVYFALDEYQLNEEDKLRLTSLAEQMLQPENSHLRLRIEGHCDDRGTREYNFALGERRAASVARFLKIKGLEASRIHTISYGKERPVAFGTSEAVRAQNRRAQMTILMGAKN